MMTTVEKAKAGRLTRRLILAAGILVFLLTASVSAVSVPSVSPDASSIVVKDQEEVTIRGTVSVTKGQTLVLYAADGKSVLKKVVLGRSGEAERFELKVPQSALKRPGKTVVYLKSLQAKGIAASKKISVSIRAVRSQTILAASSVTLTNLKKSAKLNAKASSKMRLTYSSDHPGIVAVSSAGKLTRKKNGKAVITICQKGDSRFAAAVKKVIVISRKSTRQEQIDGAVAWAVKIARDNSFTYGSGRGAHHFGCYFCGTNYGPRKHMKPSRKYKKTYCCNPFISAAYAHGAKHPKMLAACRRASGIGMEKSSFYRYGCWKCVGKPAYKKLKKGDVLVCSSHVAMYIGKKKLVEASGGNWSAGSIATRKMSRSRYRGFSFVMRYTGY